MALTTRIPIGEAAAPAGMPFHQWVHSDEAQTIAQRLHRFGMGAVLWAQRAAYDEHHPKEDQ